VGECVSYILGSKYGIAVFEEIDEREFNPSVALELGFMLAQNKRCLILKDRRMPRMPTDIVGKLYKEFDTYDITASITAAVESWIRDIGLA
jgi:nucleoside 2-deoxyribosyltransferase